MQAAAKRRLADEYDAAQERGEVATARDGKLGRHGKNPHLPIQIADFKATAEKCTSSTTVYAMGFGSQNIF